MSVAEARVPTLRFPEFLEDWRPLRGGDAFNQRRERGENGLPLYSVTIDQGMVRRDSLDREIASEMGEEANLRASKDDLAYNMMRMWQGAVGRAPEDCMVSPAYVVLAPKQDTSPDFFEHWFKRARSLYLLGAYSYGITSDRLRLYFRDFSKIPMTLPGTAEQQKIADFLGQVDSRIALLSLKASALKRYKREVMRQLFSRELRFRRSDGLDFPDWEEVPLSSAASRVANPVRFSSGIETSLLIELENLESETGRLIIGENPSDQLSLKLAFKPNDVLFSKLRPYLQKFWFADSEGACSSEIWVLRSRLSLPKFLYYFIQTERFIRVANQSSGSKMPRADWSIVSKLPFPLPHPDEQRKISDMLGAIDDKVACVVAQIETTRLFKKGILQQMFV